MSFKDYSNKRILSTIKYSLLLKHVLRNKNLIVIIKSNNVLFNIMNIWLKLFFVLSFRDKVLSFSDTKRHYYLQKINSCNTYCIS